MRTHIYKYTDRHCHDLPIDINGNEITSYINSFYKEYLMNENTNGVSYLSIFRNDIENNMKIFEKELQKFFKWFLELKKEVSNGKDEIGN